MRHQGAGGARRSLLQAQRRGLRRQQNPLPERGTQLRARNRPRSQQDRLAAGAIDDGGFNTALAVAAIKHQQTVSQLAAHMGGAGRADPPEAVGARRGNAPQRLRPLGQQAQQSQGHRVRGAAQTDAVLAPRSGLRHAFAARQDQGQRAGPEGAGQGLRKGRHERGEMRQGLGTGLAIAHTIGHMDDQRVVGGAAFGGKYGSYCHGVFRIAPQAVHRLGGQADQATGAQAGGGGFQRGVQAGGRAGVQQHGGLKRRDAEQLRGLQGHRARSLGVLGGDGEVTHLAASAGLGFAVQMQMGAGQGQHA